MSEGFPEFYHHHQQFDHGDDQWRSCTGATASAAAFPYLSSQTNFHMFDPSFLSFSELFQGSSGQNPYFGASALSPGAVSDCKEELPRPPPATPNSSISSENCDDSTKEKREVANETLHNHEGNGSKKNAKAKKKGSEKKEKRARLAFMTKSEVDHLEDGYKWRKYGHKAVKNSPYPRSYYRCTTEKCQVKKRVERSFEDPSIVITTYEGQHNHHFPATLRGHMAAARIFPPSMLSPLFELPNGPSFSQEPLATVQMPHMYLDGGDGGAANLMTNHHQRHLSVPRQVHQYPDYGLLEDIIPRVFPK